MGAASGSSLEERHNREHTSSYPPYPFYPRYVDTRVFPLEFTTGQISSQVLVYRKINPTLCNTGCVLMVRYRYPNLSCVGIEKGSRQLEKDYSKVMNQSASIGASIWWYEITKIHLQWLQWLALQLVPHSSSSFTNDDFLFWNMTSSYHIAALHWHWHVALVSCRPHAAFRTCSLTVATTELITLDVLLRPEYHNPSKCSLPEPVYLRVLPMYNLMHRLHGCLEAYIYSHANLNKPDTWK